MWTIQAVSAEGTAIPISFREILGQQSLKEVIATAREMPNSNDVLIPWELLDESAAQGPAPWTDPIQLWAERAQEGFERFSRAEERRVVVGPTLRSTQYGVEVWHHPSTIVVVVPANTSQLKLRYDFDDEEIGLSQGAVFPLYEQGELAPTLDARLYAGHGSAIFEADAPPANWSSPPVTRWFEWRLRVAGLAGLFVGRLARRLITGHPTDDFLDAGFAPRLSSEEGRVPDICPRLENWNQRTKRLAVVVHGSFACGVEIAQKVQAARPAASLARFEHDTFEPIPKNAASLHREIVRIRESGVEDLTLIAHSRGGLVACLAAAAVRDSLNVRVFTCGTPHQGTPMAAVGGLIARGIAMTMQPIGALYRLGARARRGTLTATITEGVLSYIIGASQLPPGIAAMRSHSDVISTHQLMLPLVNLTTWAGDCDPMLANTLGHGLLMSMTDGAFDGEPNDMIVSTESANNGRPTASVLDCDHFRYFDRPEVLTALPI